MLGGIRSLPERIPSDTARPLNWFGSTLTTFLISDPMHFRRVYLESFGYTLPDEIVTTAQLEQRLAPLYKRLRLPEGRLELMTGIRERRFFPAGTRPGDVSKRSAQLALEASGLAAEQ